MTMFPLLSGATPPVGALQVAENTCLAKIKSPELASVASNESNVPLGASLPFFNFPTNLAILPLPSTAVRRQLTFPSADWPPCFNLKVPLASSVAGSLSLPTTLNENDAPKAVPLPLANSAAFFFFAAVSTALALSAAVVSLSLLFFCASATPGSIITTSTATIERATMSMAYHFPESFPTTRITPPFFGEGEETFHEVALAIEREVALARRLAICPRRNDGLDAADFEMVDEAVAIIAFVGEEGCGFDFLGQDLGLRYVVNVSAGEAHRQRIA
jgi:hypothetical protein